MDPNEIDGLLHDLRSLLHRPSPFAQRTPPPLDTRNVFRRVVEAYLADRAISNTRVIQPLIDLVRAPQIEAEHALVDLATARDLFERIRDHEGIAIAVGTMGNVYAAVACYPEALECYARALALYANMNDHRGVARCTSNIGTIQVAFGEYGRALEVLAEALQLAHYADVVQDGPAVDDLVIVFTLLSEAVGELERYGASLATFQRRRLRTR